MADDLARKVKNLEDRARRDRGELESVWEDIANHVIPRRATFHERTPKGKEKQHDVLDSTAPLMLEMFASQLNSLLTNPTKQWFELSFALPEQQETVSARKWGETVEQIMLSRLNSDVVNLPGLFHTAYLDIGAFGTAAMFIDTDATGRLRAQAPHLADIEFEENPNGFVDRVFRRLRLTPVQARQQFTAEDDELPDSMAAEPETGRNTKDPFEEKQLLHAVFPLDGSLPDLENLLPRSVRNNDEAAFGSVWIALDDDKVIRASFYSEMPYMIPRWYKVRSDKYGRSPAMTAMPDIRMVNRMQETVLRGAEKLVDPPLTIPDGGVVSPVRLQPGGITYTEGNQQPQPLIPPGASRVDVGDQLIQQKQATIQQAFFVSQFLTQQSPVKTARLDLDTPVPLHDGTWTKMGEIEEGDVLIGSDGSPVTVTHVHPVVQSNKAWELTFHSGDRIIADDEHRWKVRRVKRDHWTTVKTEDIVDDLRSPSGAPNYHVPFPGAPDRSDADLGIDPYILGLWLGDGSARDAVITTEDQPIAEVIETWAESQGFTVEYREKAVGANMDHTRNNAFDVSVKGPKKRWGDSMTARLDNIEVRNNKHIPEAYFCGSFAQRLELLRGLMDADGSVCGNGRATFYQQAGPLVNDVERLIESLGLWPRRFEQQRKAHWARAVSLAFNAPFPVFNLERKAVKQKLAGDRRSQAITGARRVENRLVRCITVDAEDELYCVGHRLTVTSNTQVGAELNERNRALAPMLLRLQAELLQPFIRRVFGLLRRGGAFPEAPTGLDLNAADIAFVSPLNSSQQQEDALAIQRMIEVVLPVANADQRILDIFDFDQVARVVQRGVGAPDEVLLNEAAVRELREARSEQQAQQQRLQQLNQGAEAASAITRALGPLQGGGQ